MSKKHSPHLKKNFTFDPCLTHLCCAFVSPARSPTPVNPMTPVHSMNPVTDGANKMPTCKNQTHFLETGQTNWGEKNKMRLDKFISEKVLNIPRNQIQTRQVFVFLLAQRKNLPSEHWAFQAALSQKCQQWVDQTIKDQIFQKNKALKWSYLIQEGDYYFILYNNLPNFSLEPREGPLKILYENPHWAVVNKASGMTVHPGSGKHKITLSHILAWKYQNLLQEFSDNARLGLVHRLDKDTSGVLLVAKNQQSLSGLSSLFKNRNMEKRYLAFVQGHVRAPRLLVSFLKRNPVQRQLFYAPQGLISIDPSITPSVGSITDYLKRHHLDYEGKLAISHIRPLMHFPQYTLVLLEPKTGRTHQLRVHAKQIGHPIVGDPLYGKTHPHTRLLLHAYRLSFSYQQQNYFFQAPLPKRFKLFYQNLKNTDKSSLH